MANTFASPLPTNLLQSRYDALQLNRIEFLLSQVVTMLIGPGVPPGFHMGSATVEECDVGEPSQFVPGLSSYTPVSSSLSKSKQRRFRAARIRKQMWSKLHDEAADSSVLDCVPDVSSDAKGTDDQAAHNSLTEIATDDSCLAQAGVADALQVMIKNPVTKLDLYDKCQILVIYTAADACQPFIVLSVNPAEVQLLYSEAKKRSIQIRSYFDKQYVRAEESKVDATLSDQATTTSVTGEEESDDVLEYPADQVQMMIQEMVLNFVEQLSDSPRWQGATREEIKRIAAEHQNSYPLGDGQLYSKAQMRELSVSICHSCINAYVAPESSP